MNQARVLLQDAIRFQQALMTSSFQAELIDGASPVLWYGQPTEEQWLTIGTNPSRGEFFERDGTVRRGASQKFYWRDQPLEAYLQDDNALEATLDYAATYFEGGRATTSWFGKPGGAKLEALLEGMGTLILRWVGTPYRLLQICDVASDGPIADGTPVDGAPDIARFARTDDSLCDPVPFDCPGAG